MPDWLIGCSGFHYPEWKLLFYPEKLPQSKWFEYYCQHFNTLEVNGTFYRFPNAAFLQKWYSKSPASFQFSVKVPRLITHYKQFIETERMLGDFYASIYEGLQEKLACVLFQLPERAVFSEERLNRISNSVDPSFTNVIEFRHESWWQQSVYQELAKHSIIFCSQSHPKLPDSVIQHLPIVYYRFHGVPTLYKSQYQKKQLQHIVDEISQPGHVKQAYIYFNNTMGMAGIRNAKQTEAYSRLTDKQG
ncbi:MAG: DUF72 domain-containing protein [Chitinophagaceae bacterium]